MRTLESKRKKRIARNAARVCRQRNLPRRIPKERSHDWLEVWHISHKLLEAFFDKENRRSAARLANHLKTVLEELAPNKEAIIGQMGWSLIHQLKGDFDQAIEHRENEIGLIKRLWKSVACHPGSEVALEGYGPGDLSDRIDLLAMLYHDNGDTAKAVALLRSSRKLCEEYELPFDGEELLEDYLAEQKTERTATNGRAATSGSINSRHRTTKPN